MNASKRAVSAYNALSSEGGKIKTLCESDLKRIAKAISPDFDLIHTFGAQFLIVNSMVWRSDGRAECETLCSSFSDFRMRGRLAFFRAECVAWKGELLIYDIRLVYKFHRTKADSRSVWIDCETGLPWTPPAMLRVRDVMTADRRKESEAYERAAMAAAQKALAEILARSGPVEAPVKSEAPRMLDSAPGLSLQRAEAA